MGMHPNRTLGLEAQVNLANIMQIREKWKKTAMHALENAVCNEL
jgi:hypothetical protein